VLNQRHCAPVEQTGVSEKGGDLDADVGPNFKKILV